MVTKTHHIILVNEYTSKGLNKQVTQLNSLTNAQNKVTKSTKATWTASENLAIANKNAVRSMFNLDSASGKSKKSIDSLLGSFTKLRWMLVNFAMVGALAYAAFRVLVKPIIDLESEMANVRKTTGLSKDSIEELRGELVQLSTEIPVSVMELAKISTVAGQLGIQGKDDILSFTKTIAMISTATNLTAEEASVDMAKILSAFQLPIEQVELLGSVINELSNTTASTSKDIAESLKRVGNAAQLLGLSAETVSAFQATLISSGMRAERAATRMRSAFNRINSDVESFASLTGRSFEEFNRILNEDPEQAFDLILKSLANIESSTERNVKIISLFGSVGGNAIQTLVNNYGNLQTNIKNANDEMKSGFSLLEENNTQLDTTSKQWELLINKIKGANYEITLYNVLTKGTIELIRTLSEEKGIERLFGVVGVPFAQTRLIKERQSELDSVLKQLRELGSPASQDILNNMAEELSTATTPMVRVDIMDNYINKFNELITTRKRFLSTGTSTIFGTDTNLFGLPTTQSILPPSLQDKLQEYYDLRVKQWELQQKIAGGSAEEIRALHTTNVAVQVAEEGLAGYTEEAQAAAEGIIKLRSEEDKSIITLDALNTEYEKLQSQLSKLISVEKSATNTKISNILDRRWTINGISETNVSNVIAQQELALKKAQFQSLGLGSAEDFLRNATSLTTDELTNQLKVLNDLADAASDSQDQYNAWQTTLNSTIRYLLINSQDLGKDVTEIVKKYQTELLSFTQSDKDKEDSLSGVEDGINTLKTAQDIFFGDEKQQLKYSEQLREDRINGVNKSASTTIESLKAERDYLQTLIDKENEWLDVQDNKIAKIDEVTEALKEQKKAIEENSKSGSSSRSITLPSDINTGMSIGNRSGKSSGSSSGSSFVEKYGNKQSIGDSGWTPTYPKSYTTPYSELYGDFIARPGQPAARFSADDTVIGVKNPNQILNNRNIGNVTININGANQNVRQLAIEIRRELSSLA